MARNTAIPHGAASATGSTLDGRASCTCLPGPACAAQGDLIGPTTYEPKQNGKGSKVESSCEHSNL